MHVVVKGTNTVKEYRDERRALEQAANRYADMHSMSVEEWLEGEPIRAWRDDDGTICVQYESGEWWHYRPTAEGLQWW